MTRRVDQLLSSLGYCSRKEARALCEAGRVTVDGVALDDVSARVVPTKVLLDGAPLDFPDGLFVMMHKPTGLVCSHDSRDGARIYDVLPEPWLRRDPRVNTIGRLDKDTSGLILLTDVGALVQRFTSPKHRVDKVYEATLDGTPDPQVIAAFAKGVALDGEEGVTLPARLEVLGERLAQVTVREGKYHQVRRMFAACGLHVAALKRTRFGDYSLEELPEGEWRPLPVP
ncbi:MAG: rRNA pseudouridine synthase [Myxococcales bacterium]|nr:rRNA pseudouridine synthase [Myxococcales bacterium]